MTLDQRSRSLIVQTPLGVDVFVIRKLTGTEELSKPFHFVLDLLSDKNDIKPEDILGRNLTVGLKLPNGGVRNINGIVTNFSRGGMESRGLRGYQASIRPWIWLLTNSSNCRIFQNMDKPSIIETIFMDHGFSDFEFSLSRAYEPMEFCVQYRETDFAFLSRLMEEEGIYYYFTHYKDKHVMVLSDSNQSAISVPDYETVPFSSSQDPTKETIYEWNTSRGLLPGILTLKDYNFTQPQAQLMASSSSTTSIPLMKNYEIYDYPGKYSLQAEGEVYSETRMKELEAQSQLIRGISNAKGLTVGSRFRISGHEVASENDIDHLLISTTHSIEQEYQPNIRSSPLSFSCIFEAIPFDIAYHPPRRTPKPVIHGLQTGIVVGPASEEIFTDEYGRVKVQFHWDRIGNADETSSCWVRVSQIWAGEKWGVFYIPRVGQEVVIEFLEGDPDRPLITGSVYNADQLPPYDLPTNKTMSGIKSHSSIDGVGNEGNEVRFEDSKGMEQLYIRAQKDLLLEVVHDKVENIGSNMSREVGLNRNVEVAADDSLTVRKRLTIKVGEEITVSTGASSIMLTSEGIVIKGNKVTIQGRRTLTL